MKIKVFDRIEELNEYLKNNKKVIDVRFKSFLPKENKDGTYQVIDRFMVIEK